MLYFAPWKIGLVAFISLAGVVLTLPNFLSESVRSGIPDWLPHQTVNLGLDLQGGAHQLLEVDTDSVIKERLESLVDAVRQALRAERIRYTGLGISDGSVTVRITQPDQMELALEKVGDLAVFLPPSPLTGSTGGRDMEVEATQDNRIRVTLTEDAIAQRKHSALEQSVEIIRRRVDELGTREPTIQRQGSDRILVQVPGLKNPDELDDVLGKTAKMVFKLVDVTTSGAEARATGQVPPGSELLPSSEGTDDQPASYYVVRKRVMVSGEDLEDAQATYQQGQPVVSFRFNALGAKRFGDATTKNVGRPFAIVLDNKVISAPVIREPILAGSGVISGNFTVQEVQKLSILLRAGALPAPLKIIEKRNVGASLGADSIEAGEIACIIAFIAVMIFMVLSYGLFGLAADIALIVNVFLIFGALSLLQATLTLPGIAGIVLTIGMAVDANVLVFERIREEVKLGKSPFNAMEAGYQRALGTILDANITTFLAAVILFSMGSGPIKGFAVTLGIGILTSVFTAVTVTRLLLVTWLRRRRPQALPI